jgi:hypothetical protein
MGARYCNWLHNGKATNREAFENGAYDTSTFTTNANTTINDQRTHSPEARFWIPTLDEAIKASYYDPNRHGEGKEGYWLYPGRSDEQPYSEFPWNGGETNGGTWAGDDLRFMDVGSYPTVQSPWGLLDTSGGLGEYTEGIAQNRSRLSLGSRRYDQFPEDFDLLAAHFRFTNVNGHFGGFRMASSVPGTSTIVSLFTVLFLVRSPSRRVR